MFHKLCRRQYQIPLLKDLLHPQSSFPTFQEYIPAFQDISIGGEERTAIKLIVEVKA